MKETPSDSRQADWDPRSPEVLRDQRAAYDKMRRRCPVAYSEFMGWSLFRHEDVTHVLNDHQTFSSAVSQHLSVPSGMDQPEHTEYRRLIEPCVFETGSERLVSGGKGASGFEAQSLEK